MPFQHRPPPSPVEDSRSSPSSPSLSPKLRASTNPRPALRTSISDPDSGLTIPFEQLSLQDQQVFWQAQQHQQDIQFVSYPHTRAPRDPSIGVELEQEEEYLVEGMFRNRIGEDGATGKNVEHSSQPQHAAANRHRLSPTNHTGSQRPSLPHRNSSFKRHASFDSPREVPLPYMPHSHHLSYSSTANAGHSYSHSQGGMMPDGESSHSAYPTYDYEFERPTGSGAGADHAGSAGSSSSSSDSLPSASSSSSPASGPTLPRVDTPMDTSTGPSRSSSTHPYLMDISSSALSSQSSSSSNVSSSQAMQSQSQSQQRTAGKAPPSPIHPYSRPYSTPDAYRQAPPRIHSPTPVRASGMPDRSSTSSLPLPAHTPYHTLPSLAFGAIVEDRDMGSDSRISMRQQLSSSYFPTSASSSNPDVGPSRRRSPSIGHDWLTDLNDRPNSPPFSRLLERAYSASGFAYSPFSAPAPVSMPSPEELPPPAPPVVLTPPPPPLSEEGGGRAPHEPFLAHAPAPHDSYIAVETNPREYRLMVKLPGFRRDAITLSTRKRRILHVVADSWEPNGGHFERRISFGYDADLGQVRAEFDGEYLRVIVPRRGIPVTLRSARV